MAQIAKFEFRERADSVRPVDELGNVGGLTIAGSLTNPEVVDSDIGRRGRQFDGTADGLVGEDAVSGATQLLRDCSVRAIIRYRLDNASGTDIGTIVARGEGGSAAERILFGLELERITSTTATLRARWQEADGTDATVTGVTVAIDSSGYLQIAMSRKWISTSEVLVSYYVNDQDLGSETVTEGDIGNGSGANLLVGCAYNSGGGAYERFLPEGSILVELEIRDAELSFEEARNLYRSELVHRDRGYRLLRAYLPPGEAISRDPESTYQKWLMSEGDGLGAALGLAEQFHDDHFASRTYGAHLARWEALLGLNVTPGASIADRRAVLLSAIQTVLGANVADMKTALEGVLGLTSANITIYELTGLRTDDFSVDDISSPPSRMWVSRQGEAFNLEVDGVSSVGECRIQVQDANKVLWPRGGPAMGGHAPPYRETCLGAKVQDPENVGAVITSKIDIVSGFVDGSQVVGHLWRQINGDALLIGRRYDTGAAKHKIYWFEVIGGVASALTEIIDSSSGSVRYLLSRYDGSGVFSVEESTSSTFLGGSSEVEITTNLTDPQWVGFGVFGYSFGIGVGAGLVDFDDVSIFEKKTARSLGFVVYRNSALSGTYNLRKAQDQIGKQKLSHTSGTANDHTEGFRLGGEGRLGVDPLYPQGL